jgi:hypothetical protein
MDSFEALICRFIGFMGPVYRGEEEERRRIRDKL